ncbi:MAG: hypothetical protein J0M02_06680 [Planctomycetes bacterium]|nr:hypothetical protein [Planctomycetota bacterium]
MTGSEILGLRTKLGMSIQQFSQLLGVHHSTAYRWEQAGTKAVVLDSLQERVLTHLEQRLAEQTAKEREAWTDSLLKTLLVGGTLVALAFLLSNLMKKK